MSDTFFCPHCRHHKDISLQSTRKAAKGFCCVGCVKAFEERYKGKVFVKPNGDLAHITAEQVRTSRIKGKNKKITKKQADRQMNWLLETVAHL